MSAETLPMTPEIQKYMLGVCGTFPDVVHRLRAETDALPMGEMQSSIEQGRFITVLLKALAARRVLEIGVFTGYSALVTALALPEDGRILACDVSEEWTSIGRRYWQEAGVAHKIDLRLAPATETLQQLLEAGDAGSFDFCFIDADKPNYDNYYELALKLVRKGGLIGVDNTLWDGFPADPARQDESTVAIRNLNAKMAADPRVEICLVPIGDGLSLACVL
jgi:predicted O-methyltransferase YrrM